MFNAIGWLLNSIWTALRSIIQGIWNIVLQGWTWAVGLIVVICTVVTDVVNTIASMLESLATALSSLTLPDSNVVGSVGDCLAVANYFFPVEEMFAGLVLISATWIIMLVYRVIKSWIPTLS
jgi:hypothetical protein